jgi:transposase
LGRRGRKRQLRVEDEYWKLILEGVGTVEACRQVGIGRKTGYRWRAERGGLPPLRLGEADRRGRYLSQLERQRIATLRGRGLGVREIARRLGRAPSTVSRELRRNVRPHDAGVCMTVTWLTPELGNGPAATGPAAWLSTTNCARSCRTSWSWSGARSRSPPGCASPIPTGRRGTSVTRRSTRRSITAGSAG